MRRYKVRVISTLRRYAICLIWKGRLMKRLTIGTRASKLAMIQTHQVIERLQRYWPNLQITIEQIHTVGDQMKDAPLSKIGGDGVFVTEIERALHERRIDLAVHSLKDLPTTQPDELRLVITGPREDVRDVFITNQKTPCVRARFIAPQGGGEAAPEQKASLRIGTSSLRRTAQICALWPDAQILPIRGNV